MMTRIARFERTGGPEVIEWRDEEIGAPAAGELLVRHTAIGLNFIDTYFRTGLYPSTLPGVLGHEAAGIVEAVGPGVTGFSTGDRIAYGWGPAGAYATRRLIAADRVVKLPEGIDDVTAAAIMLKGCTTEFLVERCAKVAAGDAVLVHAAAGGVGLLLVQWLKAVGAHVIGTVGSEAKAELVRAHGCDEVLIYGQEALAPRVRALTGGAGVRTVFDGVGRATFAESLDSLGRRGLLISYGNASGPVDAFELLTLSRKGSLFVTRPTMFDYYASPEEQTAGTSRLFAMIESGAIKVRIDQTYKLEDAARAHADLEARRTTGSTVLMPG